MVVLNPLVSIILTSYNQAEFIITSLESIKNQDYSNIELLIVDNGSKDNTADLISNWLMENRPYQNSTTIFRNATIPYCQSFNELFTLSKGEYFIDLSGDDLIQNAHIANSIAKLSRTPEAACCFSDVLLVEEGKGPKTFYPRDGKGELMAGIQDGDLYASLVQSQCVMSVSLVFNSKIFEKEGMYDETLSYEDFDIMVRLARKHPFVFSNHIGITKTIHKKSYSATQYLPRESMMLPSTLLICKKIKMLNQTVEEDKALLKRVRYEVKHALASANFEVARGFIELAKDLGESGLTYTISSFWSRKKWDFSFVYLLLKKITQR